jgi:CBS-domain-containing membrane protein
MPLKKLNGESAASSPATEPRKIALAWLGSVLAIAALTGLGDWLQVTLILGSFGASCVLVFGFPDSPFSQPRSVLMGHFISSLVGLLFLKLLGPHGWSLALAVGTAISIMMLTGTVHPPAGSNPVIIFLTQPGWGFLGFPTLAGAVLLLAVALLYNNLHGERRYPKYW